MASTIPVEVAGGEASARRLGANYGLRPQLINYLRGERIETRLNRAEDAANARGSALKADNAIMG